MDTLFGVIPHDSHALETGQLGTLGLQVEKTLEESHSEFVERASAEAERG